MKVKIKVTYKIKTSVDTMRPKIDERLDKQIKAIVVDCFCNAMEPKWFTSSKPLPDRTNYAWRENKNSKEIFLFSVRHNCIWYGDTVYKWEDYYNGEWCLIKFPD